jgi:predicted nucleotide-binding protein (sugar kinase/HSP70/actin superfamily)
MKKTIGIPRGMFYFDYYILWEEFFKNLDGEIIISPSTNKDILDRGISTCVDEACLPVKAFHGHVDYLKDKVDYLFIPKFISIYKREYCCPKHLGLPDMVKHSIEDLPEIIEPIINLRKNSNSLKKSILGTGRYLTNNKKEILKAYDLAYGKWEKFNKLMCLDLLNINEIGLNSDCSQGAKTHIEDYDKRILLLGHPYNIYDNHINMNIIKKLMDNNIKIITAEMIEETISRHYASTLPKRMFWSQGQKVLGSSFSLIDRKTIDGIIYISAFGCGIDSVLIELVEEKAKERNTPFTLITIDELTGEAGINTRIEAFLDMLDWRKKNEDNISTFG